MSFPDLPLIGMLKTRMRWLESRQKLLAENVANAETPGYRERDLKTLSFAELVSRGRGEGPRGAGVTDPRHIPIAALDPGRFGAARVGTFETTPDGNSVVLEDQMMRVAENQQEYQVATMLYTKSLNLLKMAARRG